MRKKMLLLALALAATASLTAPSAQAGPLPSGPYHSCQVCTTDANGTKCCQTCECSTNGTPVSCLANAVCSDF
jgi:hypothetical protein